VKLLNGASLQRKHSDAKEVSPFRSHVESSVVAESTLKTMDLTGLSSGDVKVSEYRLERYLNACSPTCHG